MEEKKIQIMDLLSYTIGIPEMKYFNLESDELLDEKIEVLTQIKEGKTIAEIPNFYKVLEDLPEDDMWDYLTIEANRCKNLLASFFLFKSKFLLIVEMLKDICKYYVFLFVFLCKKVRISLKSVHYSYVFVGLLYVETVGIFCG